MKKLIAILSVLAMVLSFAACSKNNNTTIEPAPDDTPSVSENASDDAQEPSAEGDSFAKTVLADFKTKAASGDYATAEELANALIARDDMPFMAGAMAVEEGLLNGFDNFEVKGFKDAAMFSPMIGTIPFVGYVFNLDDGADVAAFAKDLKDNANLAWNICTQADEMICESEGNTVLFIMSPLSFEE